MKAEPQQEHVWLQRFVGEWTYEHECSVGPDQPPMKATGTESVRSLGGLWTIGEGRGEAPDGTPVTSVMTLGYDPAKNRFVGTFIASMMTHLWPYEGTLDAEKKTLTMDSEGPSATGNGAMAKYQDIFTFVSDDHRILSSRILGEDGIWQDFMTAHYRRKR